MTSGDELRKHLSFERTEPGLIAYQIKDHANGDSWKNILVIYNANEAPVEMEIEGSWILAVRGDEFNLKSGEILSGVVRVPPISMFVAYQK